MIDLKLLRLSHYSKTIMNQVCKTIGLFPYYPQLLKYLKNLNTYRHNYNYFIENNLFYKSQYGFRRGHSTELAALEIV